MVNFSCVINCGRNNPKFALFAKKMFDISNKILNADWATTNSATYLTGNMNKANFAEFLAALDELKLFARMESIKY